MPRVPPYPDWWDWELELGGQHLAKAMAIREFSETDLRAMLEDATGLLRGKQEGRWVIESRFRRWPWRVIVEPDEREQRLVVITAYPVE